MNIKEVAGLMDGVEYPKERERVRTIGLDEIKKGRIVVAYGASDDLLELDGAICDEVGAYDGGSALIDEKGLVTPHADEECCNDCPHWLERKASAKTLTALWCPAGRDVSWALETTIPHETFNVMEDGEVYCIGLVFSLNDLGD